MIPCRRVLAQAEPLQKADEARYEALSPFEIKNVLIDMAEESCRKRLAQGEKCRVLNAGRGNPNFLNTTARQAFCQLSMFAAELANTYEAHPDLGLRPEKDGIAGKLKNYLNKKTGEDGAAFLKSSIDYAEKNLGLDPDEFVFELVDATLGDFYPSPPRILPNVEKIINTYLAEVLFPHSTPPPGTFDLFATEGATAAMVYIFKSLRENGLLSIGDHIAIITPIFSPYLEIPNLNDYQLVQIHIEGDEDLGWQIPDEEIAKLKDTRIKALFLVNPTNPTSVGLAAKTIKKIAEVVRTERKDLIILTDTVYATFVDEFHTLLKEVPENTICVYSYSKYFGATGWRLGVVMLKEDNIMDKLIAELPKNDKDILNNRYAIDSTSPETIKFIDRIEMDSRDVALAHTGGLSCPQQCIMAFFSLFEIMDKDKKYKKSIKELLNKRIKNLYDNLGIKTTEGPDKTHYYALVDIGRMAKDKYGDAFANYLMENFTLLDFLFKLAKEKLVICLPGKGFAGPEWSLRVSLANLDDNAYIDIGKGISEVMKELYDGMPAKSTE